MYFICSLNSADFYPAHFSSEDIVSTPVCVKKNYIYLKLLNRSLPNFTGGINMVKDHESIKFWDL